MTTTTTPTKGLRPVPRTKTKRREAIGNAKRSLTRAASLMAWDLGDAADDPDATKARVTSLLWAQAFIQQALAYETHDRLGDRMATPARILRAARQGVNQ